jgi:hypothetical protein
MEEFVFRVSRACVFGFIALDFMIYVINKILLYFQQKTTDPEITEELKYNPARFAYVPNFRIWAFGILLGVMFTASYYLIAFLKAILLPDNNVINWPNVLLQTKANDHWMIVILPLGILACLVVITSLFLWSIVRIAKEDL